MYNVHNYILHTYMLSINIIFNYINEELTIEDKTLELWNEYTNTKLQNVIFDFHI